MDHGIHQSPLNSEFANSFTKIGDQIDEIFSQIDHFGSKSSFATPSTAFSSTPVKSERFSGQYNKENKNEMFYEIGQINPFSHHQSSIIDPKERHNINSIGSSMSTLKSQTVVGGSELFRNYPQSASLKSASFTSLLSKEQNLGQPNLNNVRGVEVEKRRVKEGQVLKDRLDKERVVCKKSREEVAALKSRLLELSDKVGLITSERNKIVFKLEAAVREIDNQTHSKQNLSGRITELNNKLLESDYENTQLQQQMKELAGQLESSQEAHVRLMEQLEQCHTQLQGAGDEKQRLLELCEYSSTESSNTVQKLELVHRLHQTCGARLKQAQDERQEVMNKVQHLTSSLTTSDTEKRTMLDNLTKVYKLVEKLETKATHKIEELSAEVSKLESMNSMLREQLLEREAVHNNNKRSIDEYKAKLKEFELFKTQAEESSQRLEKQNMEIVTQKSKRIKQLTVKLKETMRSGEEKGNNLKDLSGLNEILQQQVNKLTAECHRSTEDTTSHTHQLSALHSQLEEARSTQDKGGEVMRRLEKEIREKDAALFALEQRLCDSEKLRGGETTELRSEMKLTEMKLVSMEKRCGELAGVIEESRVKSEKIAQSTQLKETSHDKKVCKLKDKLFAMIVEKQEVESQLHECQAHLEALQQQLNTTEHNYSTYTDSIQHSMLERVKEQQNLLEKQRHEHEQERFHLDTQVQDLTLSLADKEQECGVMAGELTHASIEVKTLRSQNESLLNAVEKYRLKHSKLKSNFIAKFDQVNNEHQLDMEELAGYHEGIVSKLRDRILACYQEITDSTEGISEDDWEGCLEAVREVLRRAVRHKEDNRANDQKIAQLITERDRAIARHDEVLYHKNHQAEEITRMQQQFERLLATHQLELSFDKTVMQEFDKIKEEQKAQAQLELKYLKAHDQSTHLEAQLKAAKHAVNEYRESNKEASDLAVSLRIKEKDLIRSREKMRRTKKRSISMEY